MKRYTFILLVMVITMTGVSQVTIDDSDMPQIGDTLRVSLTNLVPVDYARTAMDTAWDFSALEALTQRVDTFINPNQTPQLYWIWFTPNVTANLALPLRSGLFPGVAITDGFNFFKNDATGYKDLGGAVSFQGIPIPGKFDVPDKYYAFPMTAGSSWNSTSFFSIPLQGIAYLSSQRVRTSVVDGWGTLKTPFGTFQTLRVKSMLYEYDSVYIDSLQAGFPIVRNITEYKWLAKGSGIPVLQINDEMGVATAVYRDSTRSTLSIRTVEKSLTLKIYPNPAQTSLKITLPITNELVRLTITSVQGNLVMEKRIQLKGEDSITIDLASLRSGIYLVKIRAGEKMYHGKFIKIL